MPLANLFPTADRFDWSFSAIDNGGYEELIPTSSSLRTAHCTCLLRRDFRRRILSHPVSGGWNWSKLVHARGVAGPAARRLHAGRCPERAEGEAAATPLE